MTDSPETRPSLLVRIREPQDRAAWSQFVDVYAPLVYGFAKKNGLQDSDAADVTQEVMRAVARSARKLEYDARRGSFRGWLLTIARNKLRNFLAARGRQCRGTGDTDVQRQLDQIPAHDEQLSQWDEAYERRLFEWAAGQVQAEVQEATWRAFYETAVEGRSPQDVAERLGITVANVYRAKSRVMNRLRERVRELQFHDENRDSDRSHA
jgi:RNA polymerase sigma-70 factor (ECF subfamily)